MEEVSERVDRNKSPEIIRDPKSLVVVTATYYLRWYAGDVQELTNDKLRGDLALQMLQEAKNRGYQIALTDGSSEAFRSALRNRGIPFEVEEEKASAGEARRHSLKIAESLNGVKVVSETEPEKISVVETCLAKAAEPIINGQADIVIPNRDKQSFLTYPDYQAREEQTSNRLYNKILRQRGLLTNSDDLDFWFGVRVFANRPEIMGLFRTKYEFSSGKLALHRIITPDAYSNPLFFPVVEALHRGLRIRSVEVPYRHPKIQTQFEEGKPEFERKRDVQRRAIVTELVHFIKKLEGRNSRLS